MSLVKPVHVSRVDVPAETSWIKRAFTQSPTVQWAGRAFHGIKASEQHTLSAFAGLVEVAVKDVRPDVAHSAQLMREKYAAEANRHRQIAQEQYGAVSRLEEVHKLSDLGNLALNNVFELSVPLASAALASRAGLPGLVVAGQVLNTAFNVKNQIDTTGQTDLSHAATVAIPQTAMQFAVGPLFRNTNPLSWFAGGASASATHQGLQQLSVIGQPRIDSESSLVTRAIEGGLTGMVLGPLSSWSPRPNLRSTATPQSVHQPIPKSVQFTADHPLQVGSSPKAPAPRDASFSSIHAQGSSFLGLSVNRRFHMPEAANTEFSRAEPRISMKELAKDWGQGIKADSSLENLQNMWMDNGFDFPEISTIQDYVGLAHELLATQSDTVWRKQKLNGSTAIFDSEKNIWLETDRFGLPINLYRPAGGLNAGLNAWHELGVIPHALADYPVALEALKNLTDAWIKEGMPLQQASEKALALRRKMEKAHQRNTGADSIVLREQNQITAGHQYRKAYSYGPSYSLLAVKLDKSPAEILKIATTTNEHFAAMPPAFAKAHQEWLAHGHKFPELKNEYGFSWRALELSRASGPDIQRQTLFNDEVATYHSPSKTIVLADAQGNIKTMYRLADDAAWNKLLRKQPPDALVLNAPSDFPQALQQLREIAAQRLNQAANDNERRLVLGEISAMRLAIEKARLPLLDPKVAQQVRALNTMISGNDVGPNVRSFVNQGIRQPEKILAHVLSETSPFYAHLDHVTQKLKPPYTIQTAADHPIAINALAALARNRASDIEAAADALLSMRRVLEQQFQAALPREIASQLAKVNQNEVGHPFGPDLNFLREKQRLSPREMIQEAINAQSDFYAHPDLE